MRPILATLALLCLLPGCSGVTKGPEEVPQPDRYYFGYGCYPLCEAQIYLRGETWDPREIQIPVDPAVHGTAP